jgi:thymidylate synthase
MNKLDLDYQNLLKDILENGVKKETRNGGTTSVFGRQIRHKMNEGFPILTTKKIPFKLVATELIWFLRGDTNIKYLLDNNCHIWDGDAYQAYCNTYPDVEKTFQYEGSDIEVRKMTQEEFVERIKTDDEFAKKFGDLGKIYGVQWRNWKFTDKFTNGEQIAYVNGSIDQIANLINDLKTNPDSRRLLVSAWNPADLDSCVLPPCHYSFQVYTRELSNEEIAFEANKRGFNLKGMTFSGKLIIDSKEVKEKNIPTRAISLMFNMRSTDVGLGLSFNLSSYALLLMMIAKQVNMVPDELIYNGGDVHLYLNHIEPIKEQLTRESYELPTVKLSDRIVDDISEYTLDDIILENYQSHPTIKMPLSN